MANWIREVEASDVVDGAAYFVAKRPHDCDCKTWYFFAENRAGKRMMSIKPGIAMQFNGDDKLRELLKAQADLVAVAVPADADKRWRARRC